MSKTDSTQDSVPTIKDPQGTVAYHQQSVDITKLATELVSNVLQQMDRSDLESCCKASKGLRTLAIPVLTAYPLIFESARAYRSERSQVLRKQTTDLGVETTSSVHAFIAPDRMNSLRAWVNNDISKLSAQLVAAAHPDDSADLTEALSEAKFYRDHGWWQAARHRLMNEATVIQWASEDDQDLEQIYGTVHLIRPSRDSHPLRVRFHPCSESSWSTSVINEEIIKVIPITKQHLHCSKEQDSHEQSMFRNRSDNKDKRTIIFASRPRFDITARGWTSIAAPTCELLEDAMASHMKFHPNSSAYTFIFAGDFKMRDKLADTASLREGVLARLPSVREGAASWDSRLLIGDRVTYLSKNPHFPGDGPLLPEELGSLHRLERESLYGKANGIPRNGYWIRGRPVIEEGPAPFASADLEWWINGQDRS